MPCNPKTKKPGYICNPKTNRWVKEDGKIGKQILAVKLDETKTTPLKAESKKTRDELVANLTDGGKEIGRGREGVVYLIKRRGKQRVVKVGYSKSRKKPFGKGQLRRLKLEMDLSKRLGILDIGPKVYNTGILDASEGGQIAFMIMDKLDKPPKSGTLVCSPKAQKQLFSLYDRLAKELKVSTNDYNIQNIMYSKNKSRFYLIDVGRAKLFKTSKEAMEANVMVLTNICRTILGRSTQKDASHAWRCKDITPLLNLMLESTQKETTAKYIRNVFKDQLS